MQRRLYLSTKLVYSLVLAILIFLFSGVPALAQGTLSASKQNVLAPSFSSQPSLTDPKELEDFIDKFLAVKMAENHIPGVVFVLVKDGEIFFSKGYGYADLDSKKPFINGGASLLLVSHPGCRSLHPVPQLLEYIGV